MAEKNKVEREVLEEIKKFNPLSRTNYLGLITRWQRKLKEVGKYGMEKTKE